MKIDILTLFPEAFKGAFDHSILKRAQKKDLIKINLHNLRDWAKDKHRSVDDSPYGGGAGMVLKVDVIDRTLHDLCSKRCSRSKRSDRLEQAKRFNKRSDSTIRTIMLTPQGKPLDQKTVKRLAKYQKLVLLCGHYEGFDERVRQLVDEEISIGPYVLTGGEIPAMVITDAVTRLIPRVLGKAESASEDSFSMNDFARSSCQSSAVSRQLLEYPHYTRPENYKPISKKYKRALKVPKVLLSGNHAAIKKWRLEQVIKRAQRRRRNCPISPK